MLFTRENVEGANTLGRALSIESPDIIIYNIWTFVHEILMEGLPTEVGEFLSIERPIQRYSKVLSK